MRDGNATLLLIDDDPNILAVFGMALRAEGYEVVCASSGADGLQLARRHLPDVILSDINMPGMDGTDLVKLVRQDENLGATQIILMTGQTFRINAREGMQLGADDFLEKPFSHEELMNSVRARLRRASINWRVDDQILGKIRSDMISTLPHELITPLAGILGLVEVMRENFDELPKEEMLHFLELIEQSGWRLQRTIRNYLLILDNSFGSEAMRTKAALLDAGKVHNVIEEQVQRVAARHSREADTLLELEPVSLFTAERSFALIIEELVDNACAYSPHGTEIKIRLLEDGLLKVIDRGRGMNAAQIRSVRAFAQFERQHYEQQGLGLGLHLSKVLAESCGAELSLQSEVGTGTVAAVQFRTSEP